MTIKVQWLHDLGGNPFKVTTWWCGPGWYAALPMNGGVRIAPAFEGMGFARLRLEVA